MSARAWKIGAIAVGAVIAVNLLLAELNRLTRDPGGPRSSSYATAPDGAAAYADLLRRAGHPVTRERGRPQDLQLRARETLILLDPRTVPRRDAEALRRFVVRGGRLVAGGADPGRWLDRLLDDPPAWSGKGATEAAPLVPVPEVNGVARVRAARDGSWSDAGEALPALGDASRTLLVVATAGRGRIALLADTSPLQNRLLARADDAALGLALAGPRARPVRFLESAHGYGRASGIAAVPTRWKWALAGIVLATLLLMLARGRRLGPPEAEARELPPPRRTYVESVAAVLGRTKRADEAVAPLQAALRRRVERTAGPAPDGDDGFAKAAARLGLRDDEIAAVVGRPDGRVDVLALGRALARLEGGRRGGGNA